MFSMSSQADTHDLRSGLTAIRGFFTSIQAGTARILVNINISHGAFYGHGPLVGLMVSHGTRHVVTLERFLKKVRVQTRHIKEKQNRDGQIIPRIKTIFGLATLQDGDKLAHRPHVLCHGAGAKDVEVWFDARGLGATSSQPSPVKSSRGKSAPIGPALASSTGRYMTIYNYFLETYGRHLVRADLPVVNVGTRENPSYLPPETCLALPGQPGRTKLSPGQTANMIAFAVREPFRNAQSIVDQGFQTAGLSSRTNRLLDQFGIHINQPLITVPARILPEPKVSYKNKNLVVRYGTCPEHVSLPSPECRDAFDPTLESLSNTVEKFRKALIKNGVSVQEQPLPSQHVKLTDADDVGLDKIFKNKAGKVGLLLVIIPAVHTQLYNRIKQLGDVKYGIHTVRVVGRKLAKASGQEQYFANVSIEVQSQTGRAQPVCEAHPYSTHLRGRDDGRGL